MELVSSCLHISHYLLLLFVSILGLGLHFVVAAAAVVVKTILLTELVPIFFFKIFFSIYSFVRDTERQRQAPAGSPMGHPSPELWNHALS